MIGMKDRFSQIPLMLNVRRSGIAFFRISGIFMEIPFTAASPKGTAMKLIRAQTTVILPSLWILL